MFVEVGCFEKFTEVLKHIRDEAKEVSYQVTLLWIIYTAATPLPPSLPPSPPPPSLPPAECVGSLQAGVQCVQSLHCGDGELPATEADL